MLSRFSLISICLHIWCILCYLVGVKIRLIKSKINADLGRINLHFALSLFHNDSYNQVTKRHKQRNRHVSFNTSTSAISHLAGIEGNKKRLVKVN